MKKSILVRSYLFNFDMLPHQITYLRDAFIRLSLDESELLEKHKIDPVIFSNEKIENGEIKRIVTYPLIQYNSMGNKAMITAIGDGAKAMKLLFEKEVYINWMGKQLRYPLAIVAQPEQRLSLHAIEKLTRYRVNRWMPFKDKYTNADGEKVPSFNEWQDIPYEIERLQLLERKLTNNLVTICKHLNIEINYTLKVRIISKHGEAWPENNGLPQKTFDLTIETNIKLPEGIGIGGSVSEGFGRLLSPENPKREQIRSNKKNKQFNTKPDINMTHGKTVK